MEPRTLGLNKGGRADHRTRREGFAVKFWEREKEPTGAVPQPENYTSSFVRRARGGVAVGTRVSRADGPGVWCCISGLTSERQWAPRQKENRYREGTAIIHKHRNNLQAACWNFKRERSWLFFQCIRNGKGSWTRKTHHDRLKTSQMLWWKWIL